MTPECPPTTVTGDSSGVAEPSTSDKNRAARTTSRVVTPNNFFGSNLPAFFKTSAAIGTVYIHTRTKTRISSHDSHETSQMHKC